MMPDGNTEMEAEIKTNRNGKYVGKTKRTETIQKIKIL